MVYDCVHNPAAQRSYPGVDTYCCANSHACTCGYAYSRADTAAGVNGYADANADANTYTNMRRAGLRCRDHSHRFNQANTSSRRSFRIQFWMLWRGKRCCDG